MRDKVACPILLKMRVQVLQQPLRQIASPKKVAEEAPRLRVKSNSCRSLMTCEMTCV